VNSKGNGEEEKEGPPSTERNRSSVKIQLSSYKSKDGTNRLIDRKGEDSIHSTSKERRR